MDDLERNRKEALNRIKEYIAKRRPDLTGHHFEILAGWEFGEQPPDVADEIAYHVEQYRPRSEVEP